MDSYVKQYVNVSELVCGLVFGVTVIVVARPTSSDVAVDEGAPHRLPKSGRFAENKWNTSQCTGFRSSTDFLLLDPSECTSTVVVVMAVATPNAIRYPPEEETETVANVPIEGRCFIGRVLFFIRWAATAD